MTFFSLVCPGDTTKAIGEWNSCNWATRPTPALVTRRNAPIDSYLSMMHKAVAKFGPSGDQKAKFEMFNSTKYSDKNLMFDDATKDLVAISSKNYEKHLGKYHVYCANA